jgi:glycerol-3-phosphate cytidylyltransferase
MFHVGHLNLLRRAKEYGDYLIVGLSTDNFNRIKGKECVQSYEERKRNLEAIRYVDKVIPEETWEQKESDRKKYNIKTMVMGDDWKGVFKNCVYIPRTPGVSTTKIKKLCNSTTQPTKVELSRS